MHDLLRLLSSLFWFRLTFKPSATDPSYFSLIRSKKARSQNKSDRLFIFFPLSVFTLELEVCSAKFKLSLAFFA